MSRSCFVAGRRHGPGGFGCDAPREARSLGERLFATRRLTLDLAAPLSDADATVQPFPDASPAKWHLAHTTWFFETFILRDHVPGYRLFDERWPFLFNSYYEGEGPRHARPKRGMLSRPSLDEVRSYRAHVDEALGAGLAQPAARGARADRARHQSRAAAPGAVPHRHPRDVCRKPARARLWRASAARLFRGRAVDASIRGREGIVEIGAPEGGFAFDSERPRHRVFLTAHELASRRVTNREWREFIADGGYQTPTLWLSDGWAWVQQEAIAAPLYWRDDGTEFTLGGRREIDPAAPVAHVSFYEADAFARWAGARLPTEAEWEDFAASADPHLGNQLDEAGAVVPRPGGGMFGDVWEWTQSAFASYPGFAPRRRRGRRI